MKPLMKFSAVNPTGDTPGMEPVRFDVLRAAVENAPPAAPAAKTAEQEPVFEPASASVHAVMPSGPTLINKNIRLPADLVEFIDYVYTKDKRIKKQDAYTVALEAFFRPLMKA